MVTNSSKYEGIKIELTITDLNDENRRRDSQLENSFDNGCYPGLNASYNLTGDHMYGYIL